MTYTETIESLRCCFGFGTCSECKAKSMMEGDPLPCKLSCKERLGLYAADLIERLSAENADLRKEIEWKDMVIALAQRKQAEAEAERDALLGELRKSGCTYCKYATACVDELSAFGQEDCDQCGNRESCVCLTCSGYGSETDKWEWCGLPEAPEEGEKA